MFQSAPVQTVCPHCQQPITTRISHDIGLMNTLICMFCFFVGLVMKRTAQYNMTPLSVKSLLNSKPSSTFLRFLTTFVCVLQVWSWLLLDPVYDWRPQGCDTHLPQLQGLYLHIQAHMLTVYPINDRAVTSFWWVLTTHFSFRLLCDHFAPADSSYF